MGSRQEDIFICDLILQPACENRENRFLGVQLNLSLHGVNGGGGCQKHPLNLERTQLDRYLPEEFLYC